MLVNKSACTCALVRAWTCVRMHAGLKYVVLKRRPRGGGGRAVRAKTPRMHLEEAKTGRRRRCPLAPSQRRHRPERRDGRCTKTPHPQEVDVGTPAAEGEGEDGEDEAVAPSPRAKEQRGRCADPRFDPSERNSDRADSETRHSKGGRVEAARGRPDGAYLTKRLRRGGGADATSPRVNPHRPVGSSGGGGLPREIRARRRRKSTACES